MKPRLRSIEGGRIARRERQHDSVGAHLKFAARLEAGRNWDGYALVLFRRNDDGSLSTNARWNCEDAAISYVLPKLAEEVLREQGLMRRLKPDGG